MTHTPEIDSMRRASRRASFLVPLLSLGLASVPFTAARAENGTWILDGAGTWNPSAPGTTLWAGNIVAEGADFTADFSTINITSNRTITVGAPLIIGNLKFGDFTTSDKDWTLAGSALNTLTLDTTTGTAPTINVVNRTATISAILAGNDGMTKTGTGTLVLTGNNTYTGTTTISAGTLKIGSDTSTGSVDGNIINNGALQIQRSNAITLAGNISGTGSLTKLNSSGVLTLTGNNTYSGGTTISDGTILLGTGTNNGLGTGTLTIARGRLGSSDNNARNITNTLSLALSGGLTFGAAQGATDGLGDLTFVDTSASAGPGTGATIAVNNATIVTLNKQLTGSGSQITKNGTGTLVLNSTNSSYAGATRINGGVLSVGKLADGGANSSIGASTSAAPNLVLAGGTLKFTGSSYSSTNRLFSLAYGTNGASSVIDASGSVPLQFTATGDIGVANNTTSTPWSSTDLPLGRDYFTMNDVSQIAVGMGITGTNIAAGTYVTAVDTATKKVTLSQGLTGAITADGSLAFTLYGGPRILTLTGTSTDANTLAANLTDAPESNGSRADLLSHAASLVKDGSGTWIITGNHTYTGTTTVNAGSLLVNNTSGLGTGTGAVTVAQGAILGGSGTIGGATIISGTLSVGGGADTTLAFNSGLTLQGTAMTLLDIASQTLYDSINVVGAFVYGGGIEVSLLNGFTLGAEQSYNLFDFGDTIATGTLSSVSVVGTSLRETVVGSGVWTGSDGSLTYTFTNATGVLAVAASAIPEPSTYAAIAGVLALGAVLIRRCRRALAQAQA